MSHDLRQVQINAHRDEEGSLRPADEETFMSSFVDHKDAEHRDYSDSLCSPDIFDGIMKIIPSDLEVYSAHSHSLCPRFQTRGFLNIYSLVSNRATLTTGCYQTSKEASRICGQTVCFLSLHNRLGFIFSSVRLFPKLNGNNFVYLL